MKKVNSLSFNIISNTPQGLSLSSRLIYTFVLRHQLHNFPRVPREILQSSGICFFTTNIFTTYFIHNPSCLFDVMCLSAMRSIACLLIISNIFTVALALASVIVKLKDYVALLSTFHSSLQFYKMVENKYAASVS